MTKEGTSTTHSKRRTTREHPQSETHPFKSKFKGGYITPPNYLAELIFEKRSNHFNSGRNPEQFWLTGNRLNGAYKGQVIQASRLLQRYRVQCVSQALQSPEARFIFKLQDKKLIPIIERFERSYADRVLIQAQDSQGQEISKPFGKGKNKMKGL
jgi:hypothetical protein